VAIRVQKLGTKKQCATSYNKPAKPKKRTSNPLLNLRLKKAMIIETTVTTTTTAN